jgi:2-oxoglutarate/2-oxoacid ferredoxin oxidoreductase subunit beta
MNREEFDMHKVDMAWCPGCGNFPIINILKNALTELKLPPNKIVFSTGIGQADKLPQYMKCNYFNGLHGRALPVAVGIKSANPELTVIVDQGDGGTYGEGGNHFLHTIRRNPDITVIVHNNLVYGLTKGQASPTSQKGFKTPIQVDGVYAEPFNPLAVAIALDASFVSRAYCGQPKEAIEIVKKAVQHKGFSLVDLFQPCPVFNKINTYQWFKENTYYLDETHDPANKLKAMEKAMEEHPFPLGIFYVKEKKTFLENLGTYEKNKKPLFKRRTSTIQLKKLMEKMK